MIVVQSRTNLLLVLKNECVIMWRAFWFVMITVYLKFESQRYWEGCQEKISILWYVIFRHHVSFIVIMNKVSLNYVQTACIYKYHVWNRIPKKFDFFFNVKVYFTYVWDLNCNNPFFNLKDNKLRLNFFNWGR